MKYGRRNVNSTQLETWSSPEVKTYLEKGNGLAIIPVGAFEQHGPHAPLGTDTIICLEIGRRIAYNLGGIVTPPVWFGVSAEHMDFSGTITLEQETFCRLITDIVNSLAAGGFSKIVVLNGHGTNEQYFKSIELAVAQLKNQSEKSMKLVCLSYWSMLLPEEKCLLGSMEWGYHANAYETSIITAIAPGLVKKLNNTSNFPDATKLKERCLDEKVFRELIKDTNGVWGDPTQATLKKGRDLLNRIELTLQNYLMHILNMDSPEFGSR